MAEGQIAAPSPPKVTVAQTLLIPSVAAASLSTVGMEGEHRLPLALERGSALHRGCEGTQAIPWKGSPSGKQTIPSAAAFLSQLEGLQDVQPEL